MFGLHQTTLKMAAKLKWEISHALALVWSSEQPLPIYKQGFKKQLSKVTIVLRDDIKYRQLGTEGL